MDLLYARAAPPVSPMLRTEPPRRLRGEAVPIFSTLVRHAELENWKFELRWTGLSGKEFCF